MQTFDLTQGRAPLLISLPHNGTYIPPELASTMTATAQLRQDTDWHVDRLYAFAENLGASIIKPLCSRYVIDLNRPPDNAELYPGANGTELCPTSTFAEQALYLPGQEPSAEEIGRRITQYWQPYHQAIQMELERLKQQHGKAVLFEGHSIRSRVPRLFAGVLPDFNIGSAEGASCSLELTTQLERVLAQQSDYSYVVNQRFKGGYITRAYGQPANNIHAVQLELVQNTYMQEQPPFTFDEAKAGHVSPLIEQLIATVLAWAKEAK